MREPIYLILSLLIISTLSACFTCDDCGPLEREPFINAIFINQDSVDGFEQQINTLQPQLFNLDLIINDLDFQILELIQEIASIDEEDPNNQTELAQLNTLLDQLEENLANLQEERLMISDSINAFSNQIDILRQGRIQLEFIEALPRGQRITFADSLDVHRLPLNMNADISEFNVRMAKSDVEGRLTIAYQRATSVFDVEIRKDIFDIDIIDTDFREVVLICGDDECFSENAFLEIYF
ncbi:MAG: hypothetical protein LAT68_09975 [Cyclobacteriaceae bacterium]|nr:hypothetical protein [Cyclobacteriaceae bacterium]MCH8516644.1 hypothetical protein [Cyclobacteriaceae bacterium]